MGLLSNSSLTVANPDGRNGGGVLSVINESGFYGQLAHSRHGINTYATRNQVFPLHLLRFCG
jgi:hypothetical protein